MSRIGSVEERAPGDALPAERVEALRRLAGRRWFRAAVLASLLLALEVLLFESWIRGTRVPPWDFLGSYAQEAYWWWEHGSFWEPVSWIPALHGGYPASLSLQNTAWYLPHGLVAAIVPLTPWVLAVLSAAHVAFGSVGAYLFTRRHGASFLAGLFAATGWFFAVGHFSNAEHPDISRGYAWLPWVLLVASTVWPWRRWWAIPAAVLLLWQAASGVYPGMLVAYAYIGALWVLLQQLRVRPGFTRFLLPLGVSAIAAALLSMLRLLPYLLGNDVTGARDPDASQWSWPMLLTLQFGYGDDSLPNDISMRSFFIPAAVLLAALFAHPRSPLTRIGLTLLVPAVLLGLPAFPWFGLVQQLPGLALSRFTMSDFKVFMLFGVLLLAVSAVDAFSRSREPLPGRRWRIGAAAVLVGLLALGALMLPVGLPDYALTLSVLVGSAALVIAASGGRPLAAGLLIAAVIASGTLWAYSNRTPWRGDRVDGEIFRFDAPVADLIADAAPLSADRRPGRTPLPAHADHDDIRSPHWNAAYYTGEPAIGGYLNLKGNSSFEGLLDELDDGERAPQLRDFLAQPGTAVSRAAFEDGCSRERCGDLGVRPVSYTPGAIVYELDAPGAGPVVLNEPHYAGWRATVCARGTCVPVEAAATRGLITVDVPQGTSRLTLDYETSGLGAGWALFWAGAAISTLAPTAFWLSRRRSADAARAGDVDA